MQVRVLIFTACLLLATSVSLFARVWTDKSGRQVEAEFVRVHQGRVILKDALGQVLPVPLDSLSEADQAYVREQTGGKPAEPEKPAPDESKITVKPLMRNWTDEQGKTVRAAFVGVKDGQILLRDRGREVPVPFERFSKADRDVMRQHMVTMGKGDVLPNEPEPPPMEKVEPKPAPPVAKPKPKPKPPVNQKPPPKRHNPGRPGTGSSVPSQSNRGSPFRYSFKCNDCGHTFEKNVPIARCPKCERDPYYEHVCYRCGNRHKSKSKTWQCPRCKQREQARPAVVRTNPGAAPNAAAQKKSGGNSAYESGRKAGVVLRYILIGGAVIAVLGWVAKFFAS